MSKIDKKEQIEQCTIPSVSGSANDVLNLAREALMNASGAYNALRTLGAEQHLPGLKQCETKRMEALEAVERYLHCH